MKQGYTHISVVMDRSGSMHSIKTDTEGGFNSFIQAQKELPGEATISMTIFDNSIDVVHDFINIQEFPVFKLEPRGMTALLDAIGVTINNLVAKLETLADSDKPEKVIFVIITDGGENSSTEYKLEAISNMIKTQTDDAKWEFVFLGANQDAITVASSMNIAASKSMTYAANSKGVESSYLSLTKNMTRMRSAQVGSAEASMDFDADDIQAQKDAGV